MYKLDELANIESWNDTFQNHAGAEAKQILAASGKGGFKLDQDSLDNILLSEDVISKPVIVISVAGVFRSGKSFLLDMMLRYLKASDKSNWINEPSVQGFPWQSGRKRHTDGILMHPEPIPVTLPTGEEAVILLMDTQGTFDDQTTMHESSTVFALSMLLSSLQIFNIMVKLQNNDLEHLQLFTEYGRMAVDQDTSIKPFQKLLFLVRDWQMDDLPLGAKGGDELVTEWLQSRSGKKELSEVREHIRDCFSDINGFLLPPPGRKVAGSTSFDGSSNDMDPEFIKGLNELMPKILAPKNLTVKTIAGNPVRAGQLSNFFATYVKLFQSDELPKPMNIMQATAKANNMAAVQEALIQYAQEMECLFLEDQPSLEQDQLNTKHQDAASKAERAFNVCKKMGDRETLDKYRTDLLEKMEKHRKLGERANYIKRKKEREEAKQHNLELEEKCKKAYSKDMESVVGTSEGDIPLENLNSAHKAAKQKAMDQFNAEKKVFGDDNHSCRTLSQAIEIMFQQTLVHNNAKKDEKNRKAANANMTAVNQAKADYQRRMNEKMSTDKLTEDDIETEHKKARKAAIETFDDRKQGDEPLTAGYLENLKRSIDGELQRYQRENRVKIDLRKVKAETEAMKKELEKEKSRWWRPGQWVDAVIKVVNGLLGIVGDRDKIAGNPLKQ